MKANGRYAASTLPIFLAAGSALVLLACVAESATAAAFNIYVASNGDNTVYEVPSNFSGAVVGSGQIFGNGYSGDYALATLSGNVYVGDITDGKVYSKAGNAGRTLRLRVQLRSFDAVCRLVERNVGIGIVPRTTSMRAAKSMTIKSVELTDSWALRELTICVRDLDALPPYARQLVEHMRTSA